MLRTSIDSFYSSDDNIQQLTDLLARKQGISLRNIEWFITNYSKRRNVTIMDGNGKTVVVHCAYKSSLDGYSKKLFDPFCRTEKIEYTLKDGITMNTTVAQLNFIRWCIKTGILQYIRDNRNILLVEYIK